MNSVDFTSGAKPTVDFTKPIQMTLSPDFPNPDWIDVVYIGPYKDKHVVVEESSGKATYCTTVVDALRNKPVKPTIKQLYDQCVYAAMVDGMPWANKQMLFELIYQELVREGLIKEES